MYILCFDTCCGYFSVAIFRDKECLAYFKSDIFNNPSEMLAEKITACLLKADLKINEINYIATTLGPGSFTGIRIGLSLAQGISVALGIPIIGLATLEVLAYKLPGKIKVALDSGNGNFLIQEFIDGRAVSKVKAINKGINLQENNIVLCDPSKALNLPSADKIGAIAVDKIIAQAETGDTSPSYYKKLNPIYSDMYTSSN